MQYEWKTLPELARAFAFGGIIYVLTIAVALEGQDLSDWRRLVVSALGGAIAAGAAAALAFLTSKKPA